MHDGELFNYKKDKILTIIIAIQTIIIFIPSKKEKHHYFNENHTSIQSNCDILFEARKSKNGYY